MLMAASLRLSLAAAHFFGWLRPQPAAATAEGCRDLVCLISAREEVLGVTATDELLLQLLAIAELSLAHRIIWR